MCLVNFLLMALDVVTLTIAIWKPGCFYFCQASLVTFSCGPYCSDFWRKSLTPCQDQYFKGKKNLMSFFRERCLTFFYSEALSAFFSFFLFPSFLVSCCLQSFTLGFKNTFNMSQTSNTRIPNSIHPGIPKPAPKNLYEDTDSSYGWGFSHTLATPKLGKGDLPA